MTKLKSLYLEASKVKKIEFDHQALKVIHYELSPQWFPLVRLGRIVIFGQLLVDSKLLSVCMLAQIPVVFADLNGHLNGIAQGVNPPASSFAKHFSQVYSSIGGSESLTDWFIAVERQNKVRILRHLDFHLDYFSADYIRSTFTYYLELLYRIEHVDELFELLESLLFTRVSEFVSRFLKLSQINESLLLNSILSRQLTQVIRWSVFEHYMQQWHHYKESKPDKVNVIEFLEKQEDVINNELFQLSGRLYHWMMRKQVYAGQ